MSTTFDQKFWQDLASGSQVTLTDKAAIEASQALGNGVRGMEFTIGEVLQIKEKDGLCNWYIFQLNHPKQMLYLIIKVVDTNVDLRVYYIPEAVITGDRYDQIKSQNFFLFDSTADISKLLQLKYANQINWTFTIDGKDQEITFNQKGGMEFTGNASYKPARFEKEKLVATISEYLASVECNEPEIMIIEVGNPLSKKGGLIRLFIGNPINEFDISIIRR